MIARLLKSALQTKQAQLLRLSRRQENTAMNLMKAYAIIAVVCSHTGGGGITFPMSNWAAPSGYFIQLFTFVSGYFYRESREEEGRIPFLKDKLRTLVLPYFLWNLVYGVLNQLFRRAGIVEFGQDISLYSFFVKPWIDGHQYYFIVPAWFLLSLFLTTMAFFTLRCLLRRVKLLHEGGLLALTLAVSMVCIRLSQLGYVSGWIRCFLRAGFLLPYLQLGFFVHRQEAFLQRFRPRIMAVSMAVLLVVWLLAGPEGIGINVIGAGYTGDPLLITAFSILAILLTEAVCQILAPAFRESRIVRAIGSNTYSIMLHHGFVLFCINFCLYLLNVPGFDVQQFRKILWYTCTGPEPRLRILYLAACVAIPVLLKKLWNRLLLRIPTA